MRISVMFKDPDGVYESVREAVEESVKGLPLSGSEAKAVIDTRMAEAWDKLEKWIEYKEYLVVDFDTEAGTATVAECV